MPIKPLVLLVDDSVLFSMVLQEDLEATGFAVASFASGSQALEWLRGEAPDAAILDVGLRDGSCQGLAAELLHRRVPFVVVSGHARASIDLPELAGAPWFEKPVDFPALLSAIAQGLQASLVAANHQEAKARRYSRR
jgi:FixJ family two-component response regulator